jgi:ketosteroid isomerase-like protein
MNGQRWLGATVASAAILAGTLALPGCDGRADSAPPLAQKHSWEVSFNRGDSAAVAALYAPNAELVMSGTAPIRGRDAIRATIDKMIQSGVKVRIDTDRASAAGDIAYFYGPYSVSSKQAVIERGSYLEVWHRYGSQWLIDLDVNATGAPMSSTAGMAKPEH